MVFEFPVGEFARAAARIRFQDNGRCGPAVEVKRAGIMERFQPLPAGGAGLARTRNPYGLSPCGRLFGCLANKRNTFFVRADITSSGTLQERDDIAVIKRASFIVE